MSEHSPSIEASPRTTPVAALRPPSNKEIDQSCALPVLILFKGAVLWLVLSNVLGWLSAIKMHVCKFLPDIAWLTFGRTYPAGLNLLVYGFAAPAGLGLTLWMFARLGRVRLQNSPLIILGTAGWNLGVVLGFVGILAGSSTGQPWMEMPASVAPLLLASYMLIALGAANTFRARTERTLYPSQWHLLAALLWLPWIFTTAHLLLTYFPVRGVMQVIVNGWYAQNLFSVWIASLGLAMLYYLIPKCTGRPLWSGPLAAFSFWALLLFGSWGGVHSGMPVPRWLGEVSLFTSAMTLIPIFAVALNLHNSFRGSYRLLRKDPVLVCAVAGFGCYLLASVLGVVGRLPMLREQLMFTLYFEGVSNLFLSGFLGMTLLGALYHVVPALTDVEWASPGLVTLQVWLAAFGALLSAAPLFRAGSFLSLSYANPGFMGGEYMDKVLLYLGVSTLGKLFLMLAAFIFAAGFFRQCLRYGLACCARTTSQPRASAATTPSRT